jgi:hypothetical protein
MNYNDLKEADILYILQNTNQETVARDLLKWIRLNNVFSTLKTKDKIKEIIKYSKFKFLKEYFLRLMTNSFYCNLFSDDDFVTTYKYLSDQNYHDLADRIIIYFRKHTIENIRHISYLLKNIKISDIDVTELFQKITIEPNTNNEELIEIVTLAISDRVSTQAFNLLLSKDELSQNDLFKLCKKDHCCTEPTFELFVQSHYINKNLLLDLALNSESDKIRSKSKTLFLELANEDDLFACLSRGINTAFSLLCIKKLLSFPELDTQKIPQLILDYNCYSVFYTCRKYLDQHNVVFSQSYLLDILSNTNDTELAKFIFSNQSDYHELQNLEKVQLINLVACSENNFVVTTALNKLLKHSHITFAELNELNKTVLFDETKVLIIDEIATNSYFSYTDSLL